MIHSYLTRLEGLGICCVGVCCVILSASGSAAKLRREIVLGFAVCPAPRGFLHEIAAP
jgi:hypothetical protein